MAQIGWHRMFLSALLLTAVFALGCDRRAAQAPSGSAPAPPAESAPLQSAAAPAPQAENEAVAAARKLGATTTSPVTTTASGLQYIDVKAGDGAAAQSGQTVTVHYTGWLTNGTKFDSSLDRGQPFAFPLGAGQVIRGWDEGVSGMKPGGVRKLIVPPALGYGSRGVGPIPPESTLIFEVELLKAQ